MDSGVLAGNRTRRAPGGGALGVMFRSSRKSGEVDGGLSEKTHPKVFANHLVVFRDIH